MRSYIHTFFNRAVTTGEWKAHLDAYFAGSPAEEKLKQVDWDAWFYGEGLELPVEPEYDTTLAKHAYALASRWERFIAGQGGEPKFGANDLDGWNANQVVVFLEKLHSGPDVPAEVVQKLDQAYGFNKASNAEIRLRFYEVALESKDGSYAKDAAEWVCFLAVGRCLHTTQTNFLIFFSLFLRCQVKGVGRMKMCRTIFRALYKVEPELARKTFTENKSFCEC